MVCSRPLEGHIRPSRGREDNNGSSILCLLLVRGARTLGVSHHVIGPTLRVVRRGIRAGLLGGWVVAAPGDGP